MEKPTLYRKRIIPNECIALKDDTILYQDVNMLITSWITLKPRKDFHHGVSCYLFEEGYKISKFYREDGSLLYWYCDIIATEFFPEDNKIVFTDLLADVIIMPDGFVKVLDLKELTQAYESGDLSIPMYTKAVTILGNLLDIVYNGHLPTLVEKMEALEN